MSGSDFAMDGAYIEKVRIENFKILKDFSLEIDLTQRETAHWTVLVGHHATGKTAVLEAIALALSGRRGAALIERRANPNLLRRGSEVGRIRLGLADSEESEIELRFDRRGFEFENLDVALPTIVRSPGELPKR